MSCVLGVVMCRVGVVVSSRAGRRRGGGETGLTLFEELYCACDEDILINLALILTACS